MKKGGIVALVAVLAAALFVVLFVTTLSPSDDEDCLPSGTSVPSAGGVPAGSFAKPMKTGEAQLTSGFGPRWGTQHNGIDLAGPIGTPIYAYADGIVSKAGDAQGFGQWIVLDHNIGGQVVSTVYGHMFPDGVLVKVGDRVTAGQHIANEGNNGDTTGAHLHFEYHPGGWAPGNAVDPAPFYAAAAEPGSGATGSGAPGNSPSTTSPVPAAPDVAVSASGAEMAALPASVGSEEHFQVDTVRVARAVHAKFPQITTIGGWRADGGGFDDHPSGRAADIMIDNWSSEEGTALGDQVKDYLWANREVLQIEYMIWRQQYIPADGEPNIMEDRGSPTQNHFDHVHVTTIGHGPPAPGQRYGAVPGGAGSAPKANGTCTTAPGAGIGDHADLAAGQIPPEFEKWLPLSAAQCRELSPAVLAAQIKQESGFQAGRTSPAGARGYTQFLPGTWASYGFPVDDETGEVTGPAGAGDPDDVGDAVMAQGRYNCAVLDDLRPGMESGAITGDPVELMLAGYNAGPGAVQQFGGIPPYAETQNYVTTITATAGDYDLAR
ncbi:peptidoglycan DD-metalloendopeptidase family protein [Rhodococcus sp. BP-241]|uniref:peptidoglycan DD-metalloendopeptidase family protein n=1 Tax=Rhodococcus sp. BP-241 TaxID=2739441 RepID=UPI001C9B0D25|nr:peptidoglycan DD-metalloendopeptidase family protein [Rhodococcus sp. BP-241]MBY6708084.1 peptidoglycan DD-metalloendopeptidase family protein [Rhodococcus sp. BP-241]